MRVDFGRSALSPGLFSLAAGLAALAWPGSARAEERPIPLVEAIRLTPGPCLDKRRIAQQASVWLRRSDVDRRLSMEVAGVPEGARFVVRRDGEVLGERTLEIKNLPCGEVQAALGLGIAAAIDATILPSFGLPPPPPVPAPPVVVPPAPPEPPPAPAPEPVRALPVQPAPPPQEALPASGGPGRGTRPTLVLSVQETVLLGMLPKVTLAVAPSFEIMLAHHFDLRAAALVTGTTTTQLGIGMADVRLFGGQLDACGAFPLAKDALRLRACAGVIAGVVLSQGSGYADSRQATSPWVAPGLRADLRWAITPVFGLTLGVDGFFPGLRPELQVVDANETASLTRPFPLAGVGISLGPSLTF